MIFHYQIYQYCYIVPLQKAAWFYYCWLSVWETHKELPNLIVMSMCEIYNMYFCRGGRNRASVNKAKKQESRSAVRKFEFTLYS